MMEMDSPFYQDHFRTTIEGNSLNILDSGQTITLTCKVTKSYEESSIELKRIDWKKNGELVNLKACLHFDIILSIDFIN